jgi:hypothetical protein
MRRSAAWRRWRTATTIGKLPAVLAVVAALLATACGGPEVVATVGERSITRRDVRYRQQVMRVRSRAAKPAYLALFALVREALMAEVARHHGVVVTEAMLTDEAARVQEQSRDPRTLARIRAVFGGNQAAYRRLVLEPTLVNQMLHARFSLDHSIQATPLARAKHVLGAVRSNLMSIPEAATAFDGEHREVEVIDGRIRHDNGEDLSDIPAVRKGHALDLPNADTALVDRVVRPLDPGQLHPKVIEDRWAFMVVQLVSRTGNDARLEMVVIPKLQFDPWFRGRSRSVPLAITDSDLRAAIVAEIQVPFITERLESPPAGGTAHESTS